MTIDFFNPSFLLFSFPPTRTDELSVLASVRPQRSPSAVQRPRHGIPVRPSAVCRHVIKTRRRRTNSCTVWRRSFSVPLWFVHIILFVLFATSVLSSVDIRDTCAIVNVRGGRCTSTRRNRIRRMSTVWGGSFKSLNFWGKYIQVASGDSTLFHYKRAKWNRCFSLRRALSRRRFESRAILKSFKIKSPDALFFFFLCLLT